MDLTTKKDGNALSVAVSGRVDTSTAPEFEAAVKAELDGVTELTIDFSQMDYISSAGLRVLLSLQKIMNKQGAMKVIGVNETVYEVFEVTGFSEILTIERAG